MNAAGLAMILYLAGGLAWSAWAADPIVSEADTSVRLGITAGYGVFNADSPSLNTAGSGVFGGEVSASALTTAAFGAFGLPDLYTDASYNFSAASPRLHGQSGGPGGFDHTTDAYGGQAIVRLGLGRPVARGGEIIPYAAGGYENWYRNAENGGGTAYYQAGLVGGGLRFDLPASRLLVLSASAEGLAVIGGTLSAPSQNFSGSLGTGAEERVSLDADYRLNQAWHAYAGLGVTHYNYAGPKSIADDGNLPGGARLQVNSMFGVAYGF